MMGHETPGEIREELRKAMAMSDAELTEWFDRQIKENKTTAHQVNQTGIESLLLLRDALITEAKRPAPKRKLRRVAATAK